MDEKLKNSEYQIADSFFCYQADNFKVLGFHQFEENWIFRFFHPNAYAASIIDSEERSHPLIHLKSGFFTAIFSSRFPRYQVEVSRPTGKLRMDDAYRFPCLLSDYDNYLFTEGTHRELWKIFGARESVQDGVKGVIFRVWAPLAKRVAVVGDFNDWNTHTHAMRYIYHSGIWEIFIPGVTFGQKYKYHILDSRGKELPLKIDPYSIRFEHPPSDAAVVEKIPDIPKVHSEKPHSESFYKDPISIYEVHLGSWRRVPEENNRPLSYYELESTLVPYVKELGFTHVQMMPVSEYPFDPSWGYQPLGMYATTVRYGTPQEFAYLVRAFHRAGIKVLLDFVPAHFPGDEHGLRKYDGSSLFEYEDPRLGYHPDWNSYIYNYQRTEVREFLINSMLYWAEVYDVDGFRVDAVSSMVYLDYSRKDGEWKANVYGGNHNLEAISFLKELTDVIHEKFPDKIIIAEESTAFPKVSQKTEYDGLGFDYKWNMGWMHDTLIYMQKDALFRKGIHGEMLNVFDYAYSEHFILPLSHDEVVHGKGSIIQKMSGGNDEEKFANLRAYYGMMWATPGKKLLFMGAEFAQFSEWNFRQSLDWHLCEQDRHSGIQRLIRKLNDIYKDTPALFSTDCEYGTLKWIKAMETFENIFAFERVSSNSKDPRILIIAHFSPVPRDAFRIGVENAGKYRVVFNSAQPEYGGDRDLEGKVLETESISHDSLPHSLEFDLPPLSTLFLVQEKH